MRRCRCVAAEKPCAPGSRRVLRRLRMARFLGRRPRFPSSSPQTGWPWHSRMPPVRTPTGNPRLSSALLALGLFPGRSEVGLGRVVLELGGFHLLQQLCGSRMLLLIREKSAGERLELVLHRCWQDMEPRIRSRSQALHRQRQVRFPHVGSLELVLHKCPQEMEPGKRSLGLARRRCPQVTKPRNRSLEEALHRPRQVRMTRT